MVRFRLVQQFAAVWLGIVAGFAFLPVTAMGQQLAFDNGNPTGTDYLDGWDPGDNGGFGFEPWDDGLFYGNPIEIDTAVAEPDNDVGTPAFRFGTGGQGYWAVRPFENPLVAGQSFRMDFDSFAPEEDFNGELQFMLGFHSADGSELLTLYSYEYYDLGTPFFGGSQYGIGLASGTTDNLNGGTPLPPGCFGSGGCLGNDVEDTSHGVTLTLDMITADEFRFRGEDDGIPVFDINGTLGGDPGELINDVFFWVGEGSNEIHTTYFTNLEIFVTPDEGVDGDYNDDGKVDAADYVTFRKNAGTMNILPNDPHGGTIGSNQYNTWRANFGESAGGGSGLAGGTVPEPSSVVLMLLGSAALMRLRRGR